MKIIDHLRKSTRFCSKIQFEMLKTPDYHVLQASAPDRVLHFAFPDYGNFPPRLAQLRVVSLIALHVAVQFLIPVRRV